MLPPQRDQEAAVLHQLRCFYHSTGMCTEAANFSVCMCVSVCVGEAAAGTVSTHSCMSCCRSYV